MDCTICCKEVKQTQGKKRTICAGCYTKIRRWRNKQRAVDYKGGKCIDCGYDEDIVALTFHHRNPEEKEFEFSNMANKSWDRLQNELDKCDLLCANCHHIKHSNPYIKFLEALSYRKIHVTLSEKRNIFMRL